MNALRSVKWAVRKVMRGKSLSAIDRRNLIAKMHTVSECEYFFKNDCSLWVTLDGWWIRNRLLEQSGLNEELLGSLKNAYTKKRRKTSMKVKLEMEFVNLEELKNFLGQKTACTCHSQEPPQEIPVQMPGAATVVNPSAQETPTFGAMPDPEQIPGQTVIPEVMAGPQQVTPPNVTPAAPAPTTAPQDNTPVSAPSPAVSSAAHSYKLDDLARAGAELVELGKQAELPGVLEQFGIRSLPELPQERYGEFATVLRGMGAKI